MLIYWDTNTYTSKRTLGARESYPLIFIEHNFPFVTWRPRLLLRCGKRAWTLGRRTTGSPPTRIFPSVPFSQVVFDVQMACGGCSGAVTRILNKMDGECARAARRPSVATSNLSRAPASSPGVEAIDPNLDTQKVTVTLKEAGTPPTEDMLAALKKWGDAAGKTVALAE